MALRHQPDARGDLDQLPIIQRTPLDVVSVRALPLLGATACDANIAPISPDDDGTFKAMLPTPTGCVTGTSNPVMGDVYALQPSAPR